MIKTNETDSNLDQSLVLLSRFVADDLFHLVLPFDKSDSFIRR